MRQFSLNIGRKIGQSEKLQSVAVIKHTVSEVIKEPFKYDLGVGEYKGAEPTFIALFNSDKTYNELIVNVEQLCIFLEQECIPLKVHKETNEEVSIMVYNPNYKGSDRLTYDETYFLNYEK